MRMKLRLGRGRARARLAALLQSASSAQHYFILSISPPPIPSTTPHPAFLQGGGPSQRPLLSPPSSLSDLLSSDHTLGSPQGKIQNKGGGRGRRSGHRRRSLKKERSSFSQIRVADRGPCDARSHRGLCENQHV